MLDDLLAQLFGEAVFGRLNPSRRAQLLTRVAFGLLGIALGAAGAVHFMVRTDLGAGVGMRIMMAAVFVFLACFSLFNIALGRRWRWPGVMFVASFIGLFVVRIVAGP